jgi:hypothetical protein
MKKIIMKSLFIFVTMMILLLSLNACKNSITDSNDTDAKSQNNAIEQWYKDIIKGFEQKQIAQNDSELNITAEYRIVCDVSLQRYDYYSLQVYKDGTGKFTYMVHKSEDFKTGVIVLNVTKTLNASETKRLVDSVDNNKFWEIPTIHPDAETGVDGTTIFIEGYSGNRRHLISMWEPTDKYGIYKIHESFAKYADTIAERPEIVFN